MQSSAIKYNKKKYWKEIIMLKTELVFNTEAAIQKFTRKSVIRPNIFMLWNSIFTVRVRSTMGTYCFHRCLLKFMGRGYPIQVRRGYTIWLMGVPLSGQWGYPIQPMGKGTPGYPNPGQVLGMGVPHPAEEGHLGEVPGQDGRYPIQFTRGVPIQMMGGTPLYPRIQVRSQVRMGDTPYGWLESTPIQPTGEGYVIQPKGGTSGYPTSRSGPRPGWGVPPPPQKKKANRALATQRAVCLLCSRRSTFFFATVFSTSYCSTFDGKQRE